MLWTIALNSVCLVFVLGLVLVPQLAEDAVADSTVNVADDGPCDFVFESTWVQKTQSVSCCSQLYQNETFATPDSVLAVINDLLEGSGFMAHSPFFYGYYSGTFVFELSGGARFNFPLAYFLVMLTVFTVNLVAVVFSSAKSFKVRLEQVS